MSISSKVFVPQKISPFPLDGCIFYWFGSSLVVVEPVDNVEETSLAHIKNFKGLKLAELEEKCDQLTYQRMLKRQIVGIEQQQQQINTEILLKSRHILLNLLDEIRNCSFHLLVEIYFMLEGARPG